MISIVSSNNDSRLHFYEEIDRHINSLNIKFRQQTVITRSMNEKIISCLQNNLSSMETDSRFISWCRHLFALRIIGIEQFLCDIRNGKSVLLYENMYDVFKMIHIETAHGGRDKCLDNLAINYS